MFSHVTHLVAFSTLAPALRSRLCVAFTSLHSIVEWTQDYDGSHIKGLVMNFFHYFWPKLLEVARFPHH
jgi:hypothetical protein